MIFKTDTHTLHNVRIRIFSVLQQSDLSTSQAARVLAQCHSHIRNRATIEGMAKELGLELDGFQTNADLELYYDILKDGQDIGFISKGWDDPGFRVGELLVLPADTLDAFRACAAQIMDLCSTNGVVCTGRLTPEGLELNLLANIYTEGFNIATFLQTLEAVRYCATKVRAIMSGG